MFMCENVKTAQGMLAQGWGFLNFIVGMVFIITYFYMNKLLNMSYNNSQYNGRTDWNMYYGESNQGQNQGDDNDEYAQKLAMIDYEFRRSRDSLKFASIFVAVAAIITSLFGFAVMGFVTSVGHHSCFFWKSGHYLKLSLNICIGFVVGFANLLLCSVVVVLYGNYLQMGIYSSNSSYNEYEGEDQSLTLLRKSNENKIKEASYAFSVMCICLALAYYGYGLVSYLFREVVLEEAKSVQKQKMLKEKLISQNDSINAGGNLDINNQTSRKFTNSDQKALKISPGCSSVSDSNNEAINWKSNQESDFSVRIDPTVRTVVKWVDKQGSYIGKTKETNQQEARDKYDHLEPVIKPNPPGRPRGRSSTPRRQKFQERTEISEVV